MLEQGIEKLHAQEMALWSRLKDEVKDIDKFDSGDVSTILDVNYDIACRTGLQCTPLVHERIGTVDIHGTVSLSIGPFNTEAHIDAAIEALKDITSIPR